MRCEGTGSLHAMRDVVLSEVVVVAEKALAVPVAQDQFDRDGGRGGGVSGEAVVVSKGHDIAFETRDCSSSEL